MRFKWTAGLLMAAAVLGFAATSQAATEIRVAYSNQVGEPVDVAVKQWAEAVKQASNGELRLVPFPAGQLGAETAVIQQARFGAPIITISAYSNFLETVPELAVLDAPYLADSFDAKLKVFKSDWFATQMAQLQSNGYHVVIPNAVYGVRNLLADQPVTGPDDLAGVKVRVQNSKMFVQTIKAMGGVPTPMSLGEVYPALAQGVINGLENPAPVLFGGKFYEVVKDLTLTRHLHMIVAFISGEAFWRQLTPEQQQILTRTGQDMAKHLRQLVDASNQKALEQLQAQGVTVHEVDTAPFAKRAAEIIPAAFPQWPEGLYDKIRRITGAS